MVIAALIESEEADGSSDPFGAAWPRPTLQLLPDALDVDEALGATEEPARVEARPGATSGRALARAVAPSTIRSGVDVTQRRARRAEVQRRRRGLALVTTAAGLVCGLALPLSALGGSSAGRHAGETTATGSVYVVRSGDTLWSIATHFDQGGDPRPLAEAIAKETGSAAVVPGERIAIP